MFTNYYVWKNKDSSIEKLHKLLNDDEGVAQNRIALTTVSQPKKFESEEQAFEELRKHIGNPEVSETIAEQYTLVEVEESSSGNMEIIDLEKDLLDMSNCSNCTYGRMRNQGEHVYKCDNCGNEEFHN